MFKGRRHVTKKDLNLPAHNISQGGSIATIRDVEHLHTSHHFEQLTGHMRGGPDAGRRHTDLAWIGLGVGDELGNRLGWNQWIYFQD
jgi:hypothetical protein